MFTALGSNIVDVSFFLPGSATAALTSRFGVVFSDVDYADTTTLDLFDVGAVSLGEFATPNRGGANETFSFLGVRFTEGHIVSRVRITSGNQILQAGNVADDLVVMDDFVHGEPILAAAQVPEPPSLLLLSLALGTLVMARISGRQRL